MNRNNTGKLKRTLFEFILFAALVLFDLATKQHAVDTLKGKAPFVMIPGVLELRYLENVGAAFSMLSGHQWIFMIIATAAVVIIFVLLYRLPGSSRYYPARICLVFIAAGAAGNLIDRITLHYVRDFIYFSIIDFPIFNVADIYVTVMTTVLVVLLLFYYREDDYQTIRGKKNDDKNQNSSRQKSGEEHS